MADNKLAPQSKNKLPWYEQALPMEGRATFLPFQDTMPGSVMNQRSWALPGIIAGAANAITAPGRAYSGSDPNFNPEEEAANFAMNMMGGGMVASRAAPAPVGSLGMNTWHGSPHRFPPTAKNPLGEFDPMKIGTGEGAQAYGHGAGYLAESPVVAKEYQTRLTQSRPLDFTEKRLSALYQKTGNWESAVDEALKGAHLSPKEATKLRNQWLKMGPLTRTTDGALYKVDLPDAQIAKMLDWDKPLSQQPTALKPLLKDIENAGAFAAEKIKVLAQQPGLADWAKRDLMNDAAQIATSKSLQHVSGVLKRMQLDYGISPDSGPFKNVANDFLGFVKGMQAVPNMDTGGGAISYLQARYGQEAASKMLRDAGIPGIRYLDAGSRAGGKSTSNFVVFDPAHMNIIGRE